MIGEHRMLAKAMPYEGASRVPLILHVPGMEAQRVAAPVSQIDLVPTLLDLLGQEAPAHLHGSSLLPRLGATVGSGASSGATAAAAKASSGDGTPGDEPVFIEWHGVGGRDGAVSGYRPPLDDGSAESETIFRAMQAQARTIRLGRWKLTVDQAGEHELYDLEADPAETTNLLFGDRASDQTRAVVEELWGRLKAWQARTGDTTSLPAPRVR
jgi:arylsulfatase A-like enzyme